ncbi:MAG: 6-phosphogluconolactonase [Cytophagales bacterium]|nr:6-phosphogluconolactonase [Cytophagales bacterium]
MTKDIKVFDDNPAVAQAFATFLVEFTTGRDKTTIALSGGSTPKLLFDILAKQYADKIDWQSIHFFWGDERCVPPDDADSNFGMTKSLLFDHVNIDNKKIHRVLGETEPEAEAKRYGEVLSEVCTEVNGLPSVDLMILGMGDDGHTASIFPHQMELLTAPESCAIAEHPTSGQKRVTINGPVLNNSGTVAFLVTGEKKADKVSRALDASADHSDIPAAHVTGQEQLWFLDKGAASLLS